MIAPTPQQLRILRLLNAGAEIRGPESPTGAYRLLINAVQVGLVRVATMVAIVDAGWVQRDSGNTHWVIGRSGRAHAEVGAFVRAFSESA